MGSFSPSRSQWWFVKGFNKSSSSLATFTPLLRFVKGSNESSPSNQILNRFAKSSNESSPSSLFPTLRPVKNFIESLPSWQFVKGSTNSSLPSTSFHFNSIATIILAIILCIKIYQLLRQQTYFKSIHSINCSPSLFLQVWFMTATDFVIRAAEIRRTHPTRPPPENDSVCYTSCRRAIGCIVLLTLSHTANALSSPRQMTKKPVTASTPRRL
jgi:hypothetical protein